MRWQVLQDGLKTRSDVTAVCQRLGYDTLEELFAAAGEGGADDLAAELVADWWRTADALL